MALLHPLKKEVKTNKNSKYVQVSKPEELEKYPASRKNAITFSIPWLGSKRVAFVPLYRTNAAPPDQIPPDWGNAILSRVIYDPRPEANGADRSLRAWLRAVSSGRADIDPLILPMQTINKQHVEANELEGTLGGPLRNQGVESAVLVMLGGKGAGTNSGFWSRVVMAESNGVWLMELIHGLTLFKDLYHFNNDVDPAIRDIGTFDQMSASSQTHPTAFTKNELSWLDALAIRLHSAHVTSASYRLQYMSLTQPPLTGQVSAVRIGAGFPYVMVEARRRTDQFEAGMPSTGDYQERGIASEGVIAYRVQTRNPTIQEREGNKKPLYLMTLTALQPGQSAMLDGGMILSVTGTHPGGMIVRIRKRPPQNEPVTVPDVIGAGHRAARFVIQAAGVVARFSGPLTNSEVQSQSPEGGEVVQKGSSVRLKMARIESITDSRTAAEKEEGSKKR